MSFAAPIPRAQSDAVNRFSDQLHLIYGASADPRRWTEAIAAIAQSLGADRALLFTPFVGPDRGGLLFPWRIEEQHLGIWASRYIDHDIWAAEAQNKGLWHEGAVLTDRDLVPDAVLRESVFYREFLSQIGIARVCVGVVFGGSPGLPSTSLSLFRGPDDAPFGEDDKRSLTRLVPHLSRALGLMHRLSHARHQSETLRAALDRLSVGVFLLDGEFRLSHANGAAHRVLERADGLALDGQQRLRGALQGASERRLEDWLEQAARLPVDQRHAFNQSVQVPRHDGLAHYSLQWCPLELEDPLTHIDSARHIVFVTDPRRVDLPDAPQLQQALGLSAAEARVATALVEGCSYREAAERLHITEETVRSHTKAVYAKTRTRHKVGLTRLILSLSSAGV